NRPKMGFPVPFGVWTRADWNLVVRDVLLDRRTRQRGIFDPAAVQALLRDHASGATDGGDRLWSLLNLELWYRTFIDKQGVQTLSEPSAAARSRRVVAKGESSQPQSLALDTKGGCRRRRSPTMVIRWSASTSTRARWPR